LKKATQEDLANVVLYEEKVISKAAEDAPQATADERLQFLITEAVTRATAEAVAKALGTPEERQAAKAITNALLPINRSIDEIKTNITSIKDDIASIKNDMAAVKRLSARVRHAFLGEESLPPLRTYKNICDLSHDRLLRYYRGYSHRSSGPRPPPAPRAIQELRGAVALALKLPEEDGTLVFAVFALQDLKADEQVILGWEWDDAHAIHKLPGLIQTPGMFPHVQVTILHLLEFTFYHVHAWRPGP
ncbi:hypothetical protein C0991_003531, partial [Blastosporella zonata]